MKVLLFLTYALGFSYFLFGIIDHLQKQKRSVESLFWSATATLINTTLVASILAMIGTYHFYLLLAIHVLELIVIIFIARRKNFLYGPKTFLLRLKSYEFKILPAIILVVALALYALFPANFMMSGRDQGIYIIHGVHIAKEGKFSYDSDEFLNEHYEEYQGIISLGYPAFYSNYSYNQEVPEYSGYLFGESFSHPNYGDITPQFMPVFSALLAVGYDVGGLSLLFRINAIVAAFSLLALYYLARRYFGKTTAWICLLFLALCPAQIWTARITLAEILTQLFFFTAAYLFAASWQNENKYQSFLGGALLGFSLLARIDVYIYGLGLLFVAAYLAIWNRRKFSYLLPAVYAYSAFGTFTCFWGFLVSRPYFLMLYNSGSLKLILLANLGLLVVVLLCSLIGALLNRKHVRKDWMSSLFASRTGAICITSAFIAALLYLYFIRPLPIMQVEGSYSTGSETMKQLQRIFNSRSLIEFGWYTSVTAIFLSIYGLFRYLRNHSEDVSTLLVFFALSISNLMVYLYDPAIYPDHVWVSRRWISVCIPLVFLLAAYGISQIKLPRVKDWGNYALRGVSILVITGFLVYQSTPFLFQKILGGVANQYEAIAEDLDDNSVYVTSQPEYAANLRYIYDKKVYLLDTSSSNAAIQNYLEKGGLLNYIGSSPYIAVDPFQADVEFVGSHEISGPYLEQSVATYPRNCSQAIFPANIYRISAKKDPLIAQFPLLMFHTLGRDPKSTNNSLISDGSGNTLLYGPYTFMEAGEYTAEFTFRLPNDAPESLARVDFLAGQGKFENAVMLNASDFSTNEYTLRLPVSLTEDVSDFELRVFPMPGVKLEVTSVKMIKSKN